MKTPLLALLPGLCLVHASLAEDMRFFRINGPVETRVIAFSPDGTITWSNAPVSTTFVVQASASLAGSNWVDYVQVPVEESLTTLRLFDPQPPAGMALIPAGSYLMGATTNMGHEYYGGEVPQHTVSVSALYMDKYEVTSTLWQDVYNWAIANSYAFEYGVQGKQTNHPAHSMTWFDAVKWCNARSEKEKKIPAYYTDAGLTVRYRTGQVEPFVNWTKGYRLPTEAEWEKAARGGSPGRRFPWSHTDNITHTLANYISSTSYAYDTSTTRGYHPTFNDGGSPYTSPVGYFSANANGYGLYDMAGNVWEWCWDWYGAYSDGTQTDPRGPSSGLYRVRRGGCYGIEANNCRSAYRGYNRPTLKTIAWGFRCVLPPGE